MEIGRVAEVIAGHGTGRPSRRASGYRVTATTVITAAHAVAEASSIHIRFDADRPGEWMTATTVAWRDERIDLAVLAIQARPGEEVAPAPFGRVTEKDAVLSCTAVGFPRFKLRDDPANHDQFRDSFHATGSIALLSNRREGTFEVAVAPPERDPDPRVSPWQGMSGAALWSGQRIIGMVTEHHRGDGLGRLAATRVSRWYERGLPVSLLHLPEHLADLPDVTPAEPGALVMERYRAEARQIAPDQLTDRETDLQELVKFCAGNAPYQLWRADPWAGKSALASWFVLHPPRGVAVAFFFVMSRLVGQSDGDAFTEAMTEQLAFIAGEEIPTALSAAGRRREWGRLLEAAAARCRERQVRLLLVVDGLDEDTGARPSIAALLPRQPADGVRIVATSRRSRDLPADVPADHPLRRCEPRLLEPSPLATGLAIAAEAELTGLLASEDPRSIAIAGFITASGGGLTAGDLAELTGAAEHDLLAAIQGFFGRSLNWIPTDVRHDRLYLFAHDALREIAEQALAREVPRYRRHIHDWAERSRRAGWPPNTPRYLLRPYGQLVAAAGDGERLLRLATDPRRHDRMLARLHGDADAVAEILRAQDLEYRAAEPDVRSLALLAVYRDRLFRRNRAVPSALPALWVGLGHPDKAEAMARSIPEPGRDQALAGVARALAENGQHDAARRIAASIDDPQTRAAAEAAPPARDQAPPANHGPEDWDQAEQNASAITDRLFRAQALAMLAERIGDLDRDRAARVFEAADRAALQNAVAWRRVFALVRVGRHMLRFDRATALARAMDAAAVAHRFADEDNDDRDEARVLSEVVAALADAEEWDAAEEIFGDIREIDSRDAAAENLAAAYASAGLWERAESVAVRVRDPDQEAELLTALAGQAAPVDPEVAVHLAMRAENVARTDWGDYAGFFGEAADDGLSLIKALALAGEWERAEALAASRRWRGHRADAAIAEALTDAGRWDQAEQAARFLGETLERVHVLAALAKAVAPADAARAARLADQAEQLARGFSESTRLVALGVAAGAWSVTDPGQAARVLAEVRRGAKTLQGDDALEVLAVAASAAAALDPPLAAKLAARLFRVARHATIAAQLSAAVLLADADPDGALHLASLAEQQIAAAEDGWDGDRAVLVRVFALAGQWDRAEQLAAQLRETVPKANAEADLAAGLLALAGRTAGGQALRARAMRIVAGILAGPQWMTALPAATLIDPATATAVADALRDHLPNRVRQD